jgi:hypothetical protein
MQLLLLLQSLKLTAPGIHRLWLNLSLKLLSRFQLKLQDKPSPLDSVGALVEVEQLEPRLMLLLSLRPSQRTDARDPSKPHLHVSSSSTWPAFSFLHSSCLTEANAFATSEGNGAAFAVALAQADASVMFCTYGF